VFVRDAVKTMLVAVCKKGAILKRTERALERGREELANGITGRASCF
jgi:hypothetical protein